MLYKWLKTFKCIKDEKVCQQVTLVPRVLSQTVKAKARCPLISS